MGRRRRLRPRRRRLPRRRLGRRRARARARATTRSYGGFGGDKITDVDGNDFIDGGAAGDDIDAGPGDDIVHGGTGSDDIRGGVGNDQIHSTSSGDNIDAGAGDDFVYVNNGTAVKTVDCGPGYDTLHINPIDMRGGFSNRRSIRRGEIKANTCENILEVPPPHDPDQGQEEAHARPRRPRQGHRAQRQPARLARPGHA